MRLSGGARAWSVFPAIFLCLGAAPVTALSRPASFDVSTYRGKVVLLDFWASWCGPCKLSFPFMEQMQQRYAHQGLEVVAVNVDHSKDKADQFLQSQPHSFKIIYDNHADIVSNYNVTDMPTSLIISRDGKIAYTHRGFSIADESAIADRIAQVLDEH